jgi:hypothetical protein
MSNPWTKKNPLMSMWMSGANAVLGSARSRATAEGRRQMTQLMHRNTQEMLRFWTGAFKLPPTPASRSSPARRKRKSR